MITLRRGDIVLMSFKYTDGIGSKRRPAVIVSDDAYNASSPDVILASITSKLSALPHHGDCRLADWKQAGLLLPSLVQPKIVTVKSSILGRRLGRLSDADLRAVNDGLRMALGL